MSEEHEKRDKLEKKFKKILKRLDEIEEKVSHNSANIQQNSEIVSEVPLSEEAKKSAAEEAKQIKEDMNKTKQMPLEEEFDLLLKKLTTQTGKYEPRLNSINRGSENMLKQTPGGLELAILLLRAEDNLNKISLNETWTKNVGKIRRDPIILSLVKAVEETGDKMRSQIGIMRANMVSAKEGIQNKTSKMLDVGRGIFGLEKKNRSSLEDNAYKATEQITDNSELNKVNMLGGKKSQKRKQKRSKRHKTRKHK